MATLQKKPTTISIIIVNYNTDEFTLKLIKSLGYKDGIEIIIVDNSEANTLAKKLEKFPYIQYHYPNKNLGFAGGSNLAIRHAKGKWIFLLNNDTIASIQDIEKLIAITNKHNMLVAAPKLIGSGHKAQDNVGYFDQYHEHKVNNLFLRPRMIDCEHIHKEKKVSLATGAALLIHTSVFEKVGHLDEKRFFMYFEDMDFSYQLFKRKIDILYVPQVTLFHYGGASADKDILQKNKNYRKALFAYLRKNRGLPIAVMNNVFKLLK